MRATVRRWAGSLACAAALAAASTAADGIDWGQFRGPGRDGISPETGLVRGFAADGPRQLWRVPIGDGFSSVSVVGDRLFTLDSRGDREFAVSLSVAAGRELWRVDVGERFRNDYGDGPRSTPTVDGERVYVLGSRGRLVALDAKSGEELWRHDFPTAFGSALPNWAFTSAPLVEGELLISEVGGSGARAVAAFDKHSGELRWTAVTDELAYSSPIAIEFAARRQLVFLTKTRVFALTPEGAEVWSSDFTPKLGITPAPPVFVAPDLILVSASYDAGAKVVRLSERDGAIAADVVWEGKQMRNHFNGSVAVAPHVYGFDTSTLRCVDARDGARLWAKRGLGKGSLIVADGMLIVLSERGKLVLAEATPDAYRELAEHQVLSGRTWTQPTLAHGRLYLRGPGELVSLDLRAGGEEE